MKKCWIVLFLVVAGCGEPAGRHPVTGQVTFDGKPLVYGQIYFDPDASLGGKGPQGVAEVRDGVYRTTPDFGAVSGPHVVRITGWGNTPEQGALGRPLFGEYVEPVQILATETKIDFHIPAKPVKK